MKMETNLVYFLNVCIGSRLCEKLIIVFRLLKARLFLRYWFYAVTDGRCFYVSLIN